MRSRDAIGLVVALAMLGCGAGVPTSRTVARVGRLTIDEKALDARMQEATRELRDVCGAASKCAPASDAFDERRWTLARAVLEDAEIDEVYAALRHRWSDEPYVEVARVAIHDASPTARIHAAWRADFLREQALLAGNLCMPAMQLAATGRVCETAPEDLPPELAMHAQSLRPGELSRPTIVGNAFVILARRGGDVPSKESIRDILAQRALAPLRQEARRQWRAGLRSKHGVFYVPRQTGDGSP